jgi:YidC/Oxa1 family membrane protein insertase
MEQRNLILAILVSIAILLGFQFFYEAPRIEQARQQQAQIKPQAEAPAAPGVAPAPVPTGPTAAELSRDAALAASPRVPINTKRLHGSVALKGGRLDDLTLVDYRLTVAKGSPEIVLLSPVGAPEPYYGETGWVATAGGAVRLPGPETLWQADGNELSPARPLTLTWDNGEGLRFVRRFAVDDNYLFTVTERVDNAGGQAVSLFPYALVSRHGTPHTLGFYILHEGPVGVFRDKADGSGTLKEISYSNLADEKVVEQNSTGGWIGFTDKYWLTALIPAQDMPLKAGFHYGADAKPRYQADYLGGAVEVASGAAGEVQHRLFAGAKEVQLLDRYQEALAIPRFDRAIDWGWFYFLTRPIFFAIDYFNRMLGNFGLAILLFTVIIKVLFLPLAHKSYVAMNHMKELQPEMAKLRERYAGDRERLNREMMDLYKREKVNPAAGCLPIVVQIPVFFALYKVLFITIEMRHAPFYGWVADLSAPDPTSWINLFGLLPFAVPDLGPLAVINIGAWPIVMGISMWLQMKMNPQPPDPVQAKIFMLMPIIFTFMLGTFPVGLVIYWTWNNLLSIGQQWLIMKKMGARKKAT